MTLCYFSPYFPPLTSVLTLLGGHWLSCFLNIPTLFVISFAWKTLPFPHSSPNPSSHLSGVTLLSSSLQDHICFPHAPTFTQYPHTILSSFIFSHHTFYHLTHIHTCLFPLFLNQNVSSLKERKSFYLFPLLCT